jgi:hypothetical protein
LFAAVRRRAERDLLEARDHLQAANKELESFAYSASQQRRGRKFPRPFEPSPFWLRRMPNRWW